MTELFTDHCIDDLPMTASDAFEIFKMNFPLTPVKKSDVNSISIDMVKSIADHYLVDAERIIKCFNLPLEASLYKGPLFATLTIEFKRI